MSISEKEPAYIRTPRIAKPSEISYEITWAEERSDPKCAYFEFDDQPDITGPYALSDPRASTNSRATFRSTIQSSISRPSSIRGPSGMTAQAVAAGTTMNSGASQKTTLSPQGGIMSSFTPSFNPSTSVCSTPQGPTRLGP